jgi:hypothetical protein
MPEGVSAAGAGAPKTPARTATTAGTMLGSSLPSETGVALLCCIMNEIVPTSGRCRMRADTAAAESATICPQDVLGDRQTLLALPQQQPLPSTPHFSGARQAVCLAPRYRSSPAGVTSAPPTGY